MNLKANQYFGITTESLRTENFKISLTNHSSNSNISLHAHSKPYLCLLASVSYKEESKPYFLREIASLVEKFNITPTE